MQNTKQGSKSKPGRASVVYQLKRCHPKALEGFLEGFESLA